MFTLAELDFWLKGGVVIGTLYAVFVYTKKQQDDLAVERKIMNETAVKERHEQAQRAENERKNMLDHIEHNTKRFEELTNQQAKRFESITKEQSERCSKETEKILALHKEERKEDRMHNREVSKNITSALVELSDLIKEMKYKDDNK